MSGQNRSAGYCMHCQKGVTIVRPTGNGFFGRVRTALVNNEDSWVCSKCGNPATKGFSPPADLSATESTAPSPLIENQNEVSDKSAATSATNFQAFNTELAEEIDTNLAVTPDPAESINPEAFAVASSPATNSEPEVSCHLCNHPISLNPEDHESVITCSGCQATVLLPGADNESQMTSSPPIIKLEDDPDRPEISKSLCTLCQFEMTYPKKLTGKEVDCPSCETHFQLP